MLSTLAHFCRLAGWTYRILTSLLGIGVSVVCLAGCLFMGAIAFVAYLLSLAWYVSPGEGLAMLLMTLWAQVGLGWFAFMGLLSLRQFRVLKASRPTKPI